MLCAVVKWGSSLILAVWRLESGKDPREFLGRGVWWGDQRVTKGKWRSWVVRCEAVRSSASQMRGWEACLRGADPATGAPGPLRPGRAVQGATAARCTLASVTLGTRETLTILEGVTESDFTCASIGSLFESCLWLRPAEQKRFSHPPSSKPVRRSL